MKDTSLTVKVILKEPHAPKPKEFLHSLHTMVYQKAFVVVFDDPIMGLHGNLFLVKSSSKTKQFKFLFPSPLVVEVDDFVDWAYSLFETMAQCEETFADFVLDNFETTSPQQDLAESINAKLDAINGTAAVPTVAVRTNDMTAANAADRFDVQGLLQALSAINEKMAEKYAESDGKHAASDRKHAASDGKHDMWQKKQADSDRKHATLEKMLAEADANRQLHRS